MNTPPKPAASIRDRLASATDYAGRVLWGASAAIPLEDLLKGTSLGGRLRELAGRSVLVATRDQLTAALALIELDGVARRLTLVTPDLSFEHLKPVIAKAEVDAIVSDHPLPDRGGLGVPLRVTSSLTLTPANETSIESVATEWVLLTSGTTGRPKLLVHSLAGLTGAIRSGGTESTDVVWGTFYDIRRYGGLQIFLRAMLGRGSFVLSDDAESPGDFLLRLGKQRVTHISGTPSHWRRALMSRLGHAIAPRYVRLSGEIADQAILNTLRAFYPEAVIGHAFASTEAGVGFEVNDGLEGFPASLIGSYGDVEMKIEDGSLRIRSARAASTYLGEKSSLLVDADGFVDTGDMVERRGDRFYFLGRRSGVINVGGMKVYPEEVETVINRHPAVQMAMVRARRSPITGFLVVADIVLKGTQSTNGLATDMSDFKRDILEICRENLAAHKVPVTIRIVNALDVAAAGKLARPNA